MTDSAELVREVSAARTRLVEFVRQCTDEQWASRPLADDDPRPVGVIVDHVADAYEYLGSFVAKLTGGDTIEISPQIVDELNARHALSVPAPTRDGAIEHLMRSGDAFVTLITSLRPEQLSMGEGRVTRLAEIAALHADNHRAELETALGGR